LGCLFTGYYSKRDNKERQRIRKTIKTVRMTYGEKVVNKQPKV
jgi:hypothetical protein